MIQKEQWNIWDVNVDNMFMLIRYYEVTGPLVLILLTMSGYIRTFKDKDGDKDTNKLMPFDVDDVDDYKVLENYRKL